MDLPRIAGAIGLVASLALAGWGLVGGMADVERPFPGFRVYADLRVAQALERGWTGPRAGIRPLDQVVRADGQALADGRALARHVAAVPPGTPVRYEIARPGPGGAPQRLELVVPTQVFTTLDWATTIFAIWVVGLLYLVLAWLVFLARPRDPAVWAATATSTCTGLVMACAMPDALVAQRAFGEAANVALLALQSAAFYAQALCFPRRIVRAPAVYVALAVAGVAAAAGALMATGPALDAWHRATFAVVMGGVLAMAANIGWAAFARGGDPVARAQARWLCLGVLGSALGVCLPLVLDYLGQPVGISGYTGVLAAAYPLAMAIALARHGLFDVDRALRPTLLYGLLAATLAALYWLAASLARAALGAPEPVLAVAATAAVAVAFAPLRDRLKGWLDATLFRPAYDAAALPQALAQRARESLDPAATEAACLAMLDGALAPERIALDGPDPALPVGEVVAGGGGLAYALGAASGPIGVLRVGPRRSGQAFSAADRELVAALGGQLALWLDLFARIEQAGRQRDQLEAMAREERMYAEFLDMLSHEIRAPVAAALHAADFLVRAEGAAADPVRRARYHERIRRNLAGLSRLLDDLLQASRLQGGAFELVATPVDVGEVLADVAEQLGGMAEARGVALEVECEGALPAVPADAPRVGQIWRNLLTNAIQHTPAGGRVRARVRREGGAIACEVEDAGPGVGPADRPHLFQRFRRGADARHAGVGLGLYVCQALVAAHGGCIGVESEPGQGARFWFTLPVAREA